MAPRRWLAPLALVALTLALAPGAASAQTPGPELSLGLGSSAGLGRLGVWTGLTDRLTVGLEVETDFRSWSTFPGGDPSREISGTDWRFAVGPSARLDLARTGGVTLYAYGSVTWGEHRFGERLPADLADGPYVGRTELGVRPGIGLDWDVSDRWTLGVIYAGQWLSGASDEPAAFRSAWRAPRLGFSFRFRF